MDYQQKRQAILEQMATIDRMEKGTLTAEYREVESGGHKARKGPYFKHQVWKKGKNVSRRVSAEDAKELGNAVEGYHRFRELSEEYIDTTVEMTRKSSGSKKKPRSSDRSNSKRRSHS